MRIYPGLLALAPKLPSFTKWIGIFTVAILTLVFQTTSLYSQTATTGAISGVVTDSTGAIMPGATVTVTDTSTGAIHLEKANAEGRYAADLLKPGDFTVNASYENFKSDTEKVHVGLSQTTLVDIKMVPAGTAAVVEVNAAAVPLLDSQNIALVTTLTETQLANLPTPGGD